MNFIFMFKVFAASCRCRYSLLILAAAMLVSRTGSAAEYEVEGEVKQEMDKSGGRVLHASASFKVFVRDCTWLIETVETNELGGVSHWEIGSTNGTETFERQEGIGRRKPSESGTNSLSLAPTSVAKRPTPELGIILPTGIPVGETDSAVSGHLWLMFASGCYWPTVTKDRLTPVFDWHASVANHGQNKRVEGGWNLLGGANSLPSRVWYLGSWGETNAIYTINGSQLVGTVSVPTGFVFKRFQVGSLTEDTFMQGMVLVKRVEVNVNAIRPVCSRTNLIPSPSGSAMIIDNRFDSGIPNRPPSYKNPVAEKWLNPDESKALATAKLRATLSALSDVNRAKMLTPKPRSKALQAMVIFLLAGPLVIFALLKIVGKNKPREKV